MNSQTLPQEQWIDIINSGALEKLEQGGGEIYSYKSSAKWNTMLTK